MAFTMANKAFEEVFGERIITDSKIYTDFIIMLGEYLKEEDSPSAEKMRQCLQDGKPFCSFACRQDALDAMRRKLASGRIPYVIINGTDGQTRFLIRETDSAAVKKATRAALSELGGYCSLKSGNDTGLFYLKSHDEDKTMLLVGGLSREEAFYFAEHSGSVLPGEMLGIDQMPDGTYLLTAHAKTAMRYKGSGIPYYPEAVANTIMYLNGETKKAAREEIVERMAYLGQKTAGFPDKKGGTDEPVWIVGKGNCFVKRTRDGFEAGHAITIQDMVSLQTDYTVKKEEKKYSQRMNSALARTSGHICLYSVQDVIDYYKASDKRMLPAAAEVGQAALVSQAAKIVAEKTGKEKIMHMNGRWDHKFRHFQKDLSRVLDGVANGRVPKGYSRADIIGLRDVAKTYGLNLRAMAPAIEKYRGLDTYAREAGKERVTDLTKLIERYGGGQQKEREDLTRSSQSRTESRDTGTRNDR